MNVRSAGRRDRSTSLPRELGVRQVRLDLTDRQLARLIYEALSQNPAAVEYLRDAGVTLGDLWELIRRGRR